MSDPRPPFEPTDEPTDAPLVEHEELVLDVVDGVVGRASIGDRSDAAPIAATIADHETAKAAVGADVVVPDLMRERALRAAKATPMDRVDEPTTTSTSTSTGSIGANGASRRSPPRRAGWLLPVLGAAAALVLLVGVAGIFLRNGSSSTTTAETGAASRDLSTAAGSTVTAQSADTAAVAAPTALNGKLAAGSLSDFGSVSDQSQLIAAVAGRLSSFDTAAPALPPATVEAQPSTAGGADSALLVPCASQAQALHPELAVGPIVAAGSVRYQEQPAIAIVFDVSAPNPGRHLVVLSTTGCQVLVDTPL